MSDTAFFWKHPRFPDLGLLTARFTRHRYELHTHSTYVIALITDGCERLRVGRHRITAPINSVIVVNPEECHDGEAGIEAGWAYRTFYPSVPLMLGVARELGRADCPVFPAAAIDDPALAHMLAVAHRTAEPDSEADAEAPMLMALRHLLIGYAQQGPQWRSCERSGARRRLAVYRDVIGAGIASSLDLQHLASAACVTRFQVIRDFRTATGLTPGAYIRNRRLRLASDMIERGARLAEAAAAAGFSDQSHLSRVFRRSQGFTPGTFRQACMDDRSRRPQS